MLSVSTPPETCPEENNGHSHNTQTYPHGESYAGECKNGLRHGKGIYYFSDGSWVQGTWENDKLSGNATFYHAQHQRTDQGTFCGTARKGRGMMTWKDGNIYKGTWNDTEEGLQGKGVTAQDSCDMWDRLLRYFATCGQEKPLPGSLKIG